jgi:hypothetical protein
VLAIVTREHIVSLFDFSHEDGSSTFLQNVGNRTALQNGRPQSVNPILKIAVFLVVATCKLVLMMEATSNSEMTVDFRQAE